jgi:myxalamid-type polyketide synthase MxaB
MTEPVDIWEATRTIIKLRNQAPALSAAENAETSFPLSLSQERLFALDALHPEEALYNLPYAFHIKGNLDITRLAHSLEQVITRQAVLRTHFEVVDAQVRQCVQNPQHIELQVIDVSDLSLSEAKQQIIATLRQSLQLQQKLPAFRYCLYQLATNDYVLGFTFHHIISDYWSENQFFKELSEAYNQSDSNKVAKPLTIAYVDFSRWQRQWLCQEGVLDFLLQYWHPQLQGLAQPDLPVENSLSDKRQIAFEKISLSAEQVTAFKAIARQYKVQLFSVLLSAFKQLLAEHLNTTDIGVFSPISNRNRSELQQLMGDFSNPLILRTDLSGNPTQGELLKRIGQVVSGAIAHQDLPLQLIKASIPLKLPQISFSYLNIPQENIYFDGLEIDAWDLGLGTIDFDLFLLLMEQKGKLTGYLKYDTRLFSQATIQSLINKFNHILNTIVAHPEQNIELTVTPASPVANTKQALILPVPELIKQIQQPLEETNQQSKLWLQLQSLPSIQREAKLKQTIKAEIQSLAGVLPTDEQGFFDLGLDSLTSIQLSNRLSLILKTFLAPTLTLEYPSVERLAKYLNSTLFAEQEKVKTSKHHTTQSTQDEPIAIVGMGCRFPGGAHNIEQFWELLSKGKETVTDIPSSRWSIDKYYDQEPGTPGKMYMRRASFLQHPIEEFDAPFFGMSPLEAQQLDPKQRLLLEVTWEALENAGIATDDLPIQTGIFMGLMESEIGLKTGAHDVYATTGTLTAMSTGRLSYLLGVQGPNLCLDTACSSSLVALHLACQSLRADECELALTGGVNIMLSPELMVGLSGMTALSADGRCKTFDESADGFGRGEGCGVVVLKRLSDAISAGDHIWAIVRGSAVNHDGASSGLTVPNKVAQTALIREALQRAKVRGDEVSYVEAHGTGTKLGDPIEVRALADALGERNTSLAIGSVKTNIGHLDASAGIAGLIKLALSLHHKIIPPHLHFKRPNPLMDWDNLPFQVPLEATPWQSTHSSRIAGISGFGMGGTNAHAILQQAPSRPTRSDANSQERSAHLLLLSGQTEAALTEQITQYADYCATHPDISLADMCYTASVGRRHYTYRKAVLAQDMAELTEKLYAAKDNSYSSCVSTPPQIAFLFTGQGSQYWGMGRELFETQPLFRSVLQNCHDILKNNTGMSLLDLLYTQQEEKTGLLSHTQYTQPALFALEYALAKLWQSWGVTPTALIGHSVGEYVAACIAGVFSLEDGLTLIAERGRLMQALPANGTMVAIQCDEETIQPVLSDYSQQVAIAGFNAPQSLVLSGENTAIETIITCLENQGIKCHPLKVSHAFHSALMEPMLAEFAEVARKITYQAPAPQFSVISNVTGNVITQLDADYWVEHIRQPVHFAQGIKTLATLDIDTFIEIGAKPTLIGLGQQCISSSPQTLWLASLYPDQLGDWGQLLTSLGAFHVRGGKIDWRAVEAPYIRQKIPLPTYPFQRQRHWVDKPTLSFDPQAQTGHPLLGERLPAIAKNDMVVFQNQLTALSPYYLNDHQVYGQVITPATAYIEMALHAAQQVLGNNSYCLQNILLLQPLVLSDTEETQIQLQLTANKTGYQWKIFSLPTHHDDEWEVHIEGELSTIIPDSDHTEEEDSLSKIQQRCTEEMSLEDYHNAVPDELYYGDAFQAVQKLLIGDKEALGFIELDTQLDSHAYHLHPALLDCCLRVVQAIHFDDDSGAPYLPFSFDRIQLFSNTAVNRVWSFVKWRTDKAGTRLVDVIIFAQDGTQIAKITGFGLRQANRQAMTGSALRLDYFYELAWQDKPLASISPYKSNSAGHWLIVADAQQEQASALALLLRAKGEQVEFFHTLQHPLNHYRAVVYFAASSSKQKTMPDTVLDISCQALRFVQDLIQAKATPDLHFVIQDTLEESGLWGLGRTLMWEQPDLNCKCIEINAQTSAQTLFKALWFGDNENHLKLTTDSARQVARLEPFETKMDTQAEQQPPAFKVQLEQYGLLESLQLAPLERRSPDALQVEVQVCASGLNFRDVLNALGMLKSYYDPELGFDDPKNLPFGFEAAGIITRVGSDVDTFQIGDEVMVWQYFGSLASFITVDASLITAKPEHLSFEQAATIPITFLTAFYALVKLARIQAGDKVLIHAAAGGVGQAAVQIAQYMGAEVFATASKPKWDFLASQNIKHIMDSRTLEFAEQVQTLTNGQGVDIVLNSLNGDYIEKNFDILAANGRFVELGKIDIWDQQQAANYRQDVHYACFDWSDMPKAMELRKDLETLFVQQKLKPLPSKVFPINSVSDAFQFMANAKQIGKVVLSFPEQTSQKICIKANHAYLITGGLGGLGFKTAQWLANQGATHLVLSGRSLAAPSIQKEIDVLVANGVQVKVVTADISNSTEVESLVETSHAFAPLKGIIHSAGVLDDGIINQQTPARFAKTFAPKVQGSWFLHQACQHLSLDFFVCFSSQTALLGNGGQANYAAANAFMDNLMRQRYRQGQVGLSINWGAWSEVGMAKDIVANDKEVITPEMGVELFGVLLQQPRAQAAVFPYQWKNFAKKLPSLTKFSVLSELVEPVTAKEQSANTTLRQQISQVDPDARIELVIAYLKASIEPIVGKVPDETDDFLTTLGIDSLKSIQLTNRLGADLEVSVSVTTILEHSNIVSLANVLLEKLGFATPSEKVVPNDDHYEEGEL